MVNLAKDSLVAGGDLPSGSTRPGPAATGLRLAVVAALPSLAGARRAGRPDDERPVARASVLAHDGGPLTHHLVATDAATLRRWPTPAAAVAEVSTRGAAALVVCGGPAAMTQALHAAGLALGLPILQLPATTRPDRVVTEVLGAVVDRQASILERVDEAHQILVDIVLAGGGVEDLCGRLAGFLGGAAMVTTTDGRVVASAGAPAELAAAGALGCFDRTGRLITEHEPVGVRSPSSPGAGRALVRIVAGQLDHGLLAVFVRDRALGPDEVHLLERAATVAALAITKEQAVSAVESKYRAEFLRDALAGRAGTPADAVAHAASLGWDIDRPMVVVVAETDEDDAHTSRSPEEVASLQQRFARAWTQAVAVRDARSPVMGFSQEVVAVLGVAADADTDAVMRSVGDVVRVVRGDGGGGRRTFSTGVSRPVTSVAELPTAYDEALSAVSVGRQISGDSALTHFDGLGVFRLLALIPDSADLRRFVQEALGELADDETPEHADLRHTLGILIDTNLNVAETARQLFFHYNTLRYRIAKLERMLGPFTTDPQLRLKLALALKVHQMRGI
jgi:purine catabolism regulator